MLITINTDKWTTPRVIRKRFNVSRQQVQNWVRRGQLSALHIEELGLRLVDNIHNINQLRKPEKKI